MKYTYKCDKNSHIFEIEVPMSEDNPKTVLCPECDQTARRHIGKIPAVRYNGTGFASTDLDRRSGLEEYVS